VRHAKSPSNAPLDVVLARLDELEKLLVRMLEQKKAESENGLRNEVAINKGQMNKAENAIEKWLQQLTGNVIAELDFIDKTTFGYLDSLPKNCGIRIIISNVKDSDKCVSRAEKCARDRPYFKIAQINKIHQRWIGSKESFFIDIGTDLKSDALGHCTHAIRKLNPEMFAESISHFETLWNKSEAELRQIWGKGISKSTIYPPGKDNASCPRN
jgi:hypothetical protein